jgi:hypothetical protein
VIVGVGGGIIGLALIFYAFGIGRQSTKDQTPGADVSTAQPPRKKPVRAWNMALGDVVVVASEMGFTVKTDKEDSDVERSKFVARIESRLQNVRALYRQESEKDSALMGGIILQLNVDAMGDVTQVKEVASRIADGEFKKAVLAEAGTWSFEDLVTDSVTILCPLLFVREGMDITTLVEWEKSLGTVEAKVNDAPATKNTKLVPPAKAAPTQISKPIAVKPVSAVTERPVAPSAENPAEPVYQIKYASSLRKTPNFSAPPITRLPVGTKVSVVNNRGEWLEIRTADAGYAGFVRKEFITSAESARKR